VARESVRLKPPKLIEPGLGSGPYQVLLIEEDPKETELYADLIREVSNCSVDVMSRLENPYEWISHSNYNLVVVDSSMRSAGKGRRRQEIDGLSILEQIKRISPVTSVILISEQASVEQAVAAIRLGAEDYLKKPFNLESFQLAVKRGLDKKAVFGGEAGVSEFFNLLNSCQMISASLEQSKILGTVASYLRRALKCEHATIYAVHPKVESPEGGVTETKPVRVTEVKGEGNPDRAMEEILDISLQAANPIPHMIENGEWCRFVDRGQVTPGLFVFRFRCAGPNEYFCVCLSPERPVLLEAFESRLRMLKVQIEVTGRNIEEFLGVQSLVYVDDATGLYNTRYLNYILDREIAQSQSTGRPFAVLFMDADHFKSINDRHGHLVGTRLLNELGDQLKRFVRDKDTVFRYGGDEFVAVLSNADLQTAQVVAERIRSSVETRVFLEEVGLNVHFTVSIGVAIFPENASSKKEIIEAADHAMYDAKKSTRNSVSISGAISLPQAAAKDVIT
jgi:two-component system, cell cycle response regulator